MPQRIIVSSGPRVVDICTKATVARYLAARNARVVRKRKTGEIVQVELKDYGDDSDQRSFHLDSRQPGYEEQLETGALPMLKRVDSESGGLVPWSARDGFSPRRFNPDLVRTSWTGR